jgi:hypothetical protein
MIHAAVTQMLLDWYATSTSQAHSDVIQSLALKLNEWLDDPEPPRDQPGAGSV